MGAIEQAIRDYFERANLRFIKADSDSDFRIDYTMDSFVAHGRLVFDEDRSFMGFMVSGSVKVPQNRRIEAMEFITRANYGLACGGFQMDYDDGDILYRTGIFLNGSEPEPDMVDPIVQVAIRTYDRYYKQLMQVLYAGQAAIEAIAEAEESGPSQEQIDRVVETLLESYTGDSQGEQQNTDSEKPRKRRRNTSRRRKTEGDGELPPASE